MHDGQNEREPEWRTVLSHNAWWAVLEFGYWPLDHEVSNMISQTSLLRVCWRKVSQPSVEYFNGPDLPRRITFRTTILRNLRVACQQYSPGFPTPYTAQEPTGAIALDLYRVLGNQRLRILQTPDPDPSKFPPRFHFGWPPISRHFKHIVAVTNYLLR